MRHPNDKVYAKFTSQLPSRTKTNKLTSRASSLYCLSYICKLVYSNSETITILFSGPRSLCKHKSLGAIFQHSEQHPNYYVQCLNHHRVICQKCPGHIIFNNKFRTCVRVPEETTTTKATTTKQQQPTTTTQKTTTTSTTTKQQQPTTKSTTTTQSKPSFPCTYVT